MATTTDRRRLTEEERAERVEALAAELAAAVEALTDSAGWRSMLEASARFRRYLVNNQILLWAQAVSGSKTRLRALTCENQAARSYSLISPPRIGWRLICIWARVGTG